jgi:hypothetical protein
LAINNGGSSATINADKIYLLGQTIANTITADYVSAKIATIPVLSVQSMSASGSVSAGTLNGDTIRFRHSSGAGYTYTDLKTAFVSSITLSRSGNTYTLKSYDANANETVIGSFSRATALSGTWSGGKITMSANADNVSDLIQEIRGGEASWSGDIATVTIYAYTNEGRLIGTTGRSITVDATGHGGGGVGSISKVYFEDYTHDEVDHNITLSTATQFRGCVDYYDESGYLQSDYGDWFTITPSGSGTTYRLDCTAKTPSYPGSTLYDYTFKLSSRAGSEFSVGTMYDFYR